ncbi:hypothetical protein [Pseudoduganella umbonata]|uniref:Uncharacterized protein n=1 Tax=Pseudoduganella umbonata TaxID=864828 RepID=A0A7W5HAJ1_9BURK|nr:hypothetical protein [Pseudoduganella umbonata]MBB3219986.1 hypothetical protein [Pseudoduganella umbonata]
MVILKLVCCAVVAVAAGAAALFDEEEPAVVSQPSQGEVFHPPAIDINHLAKAFR